MLPSGYLTVAEFRAMATHLDLDDLVKGGSAGQNLAELALELRRAANWADDYLDGPTLGSVLRTEQHHAHVDRNGLLNIRVNSASASIPVRQITAVSFGAAPTALTTISDLTGIWTDGSRISIPTFGYTGSWAGSLQFGSPGPGADMFVQVAYTAGWPVAEITTDMTAGDTEVLLRDPAGIRPGDVLTLTDPGEPTDPATSTETVTILAVAGGTVTLSGPLAHNHTAADVSLTGLPDSAAKAVAFVARSFLGRRGPEKPRSTFGGSRVATSTRTASGQVLATDDYLAQAALTLDSYRRRTP